MRLKKIILVIFTIFLFQSCSVGPVGGVLFVYNKFPGEFNTANDVPATKSGKSCNHKLLMLLSWGEAGAGQIAYDNQIRRIATIDHTTLNILSILYQTYCTVVYGSEN